MSKVCEHHKEWIKIAKVYGVGDYSEDLVQEVYIKLHKYASEKKVFTKGTINKGYVFFAIRNAAKTWHRRKIKMCDNHNRNLKGYRENFKDSANVDYNNAIKDEPFENLKLSSINEASKEEAWGRFCEKIEDASQDWKWDDKQIFDEYRLTKTSMRKLGAKYNISWVTIFTTIKGCKIKLKQELHNDYKNYKEGHYEKI